MHEIVLLSLSMSMNWNWIAIVFLFIGIGLVAVEMFMPGIGIPAIVGVVCLVVGVILACGGSLVNALFLTIGILLILGLILLIAVQSARRGRLSRSPLVLSEATSKEKGYSSSKGLEKYMGMEGVALSVLRPAGVALIGGERVDVVAEGEFLAKGMRVIVTLVDGNRVVVQSVTEMDSSVQETAAVQTEEQ